MLLPEIKVWLTVCPIDTTATGETVEKSLARKNGEYGAWWEWRAGEQPKKVSERDSEKAVGHKECRRKCEGGGDKADKEQEVEEVQEVRRVTLS